jgi:Bacterial Ig-like domain (group 3)/Galactose oxidase, central domain
VIYPHSFTTWTDLSGNLWLFGGSGSAGGTNSSLHFNDLWKYNPYTNQWTWMAGGTTLPNASDTCLPGVYGNIGTPSAANIPGGRNLAVSWTDAAGNFWLFGGGGCDAADTQGLLNDLWKFTPSTGQWTWIAGSTTVAYTAAGRAGIYGTQGIASAGNVPGGRWTSFSWTDKSGNLWLFGGEGFDATGAPAVISTTSGSSIPPPASGLGSAEAAPLAPPTATSPALSVRSPASTALSDCPRQQTSPAAEARPAAPSSNDNLWIFGGLNSATGVVNPLNDLWRFSLQTRQWTWMSGSNAVQCNVKSAQGACVSNGQNGVYGTLGVPAAANVPGSRYSAVSWTGKNGDLWLFGGEGFDSIGSFWPLNDLWNYQLKQSPTVTLSSNGNPVFVQSSITPTATVTSSGTVSTGNVTFLDGTTSLGTATLNGSGIATLSVSTLAAGSHSLTASYVGDANHFPASECTGTCVTLWT